MYFWTTNNWVSWLFIMLSLIPTYAVVFSLKSIKMQNGFFIELMQNGFFIELISYLFDYLYMYLCFFKSKRTGGYVHPHPEICPCGLTTFYWWIKSKWISEIYPSNFNHFSSRKYQYNGSTDYLCGFYLNITKSHHILPPPFLGRALVNIVFKFIGSQIWMFEWIIPFQKYSGEMVILTNMYIHVYIHERNSALRCIYIYYY